MKLSPKQRKWGKILIIFLLIRVVIGGILYYVISYRFRDIMQYAVNKESGGKYSFDAADVSFSLWNKNLIIRNAVLNSNDTVNATHSALQIPEIYLAIHSWKDMIFHKIVEVDSLNIRLPDLRTHSHDTVNKKAAHSSFSSAQFLSLLQKTAAHLSVKELKIDNGAFIYSSINGGRPWVSSNINLLIRNFDKNQIKSQHLFSSDDVDLSIDNQHWFLPDGLHDISFKRLHFSGKSQLFELDSCSFHAAATAEKGEMFLYADKFFFNSSHLAAIYESDQLLIDTLFCLRPILNFPAAGRKNTVDTSTVLSQSFSHFFKYVRIKYIDINQGQLLIAKKNTADTATSTKANLQVYNLVIDPKANPEVSTDSVHLRLQRIQFFTKDSLFQLSLNEMTVKDKDILFKDAEFGPTEKNHSDNKMTFRTPQLRLKNIDFEDLLKKKLSADEAEVLRPSFYITNAKKNSSRNSTRKAGIGPLFKTLHELGELIAVQNFHIVDGKMDYTAANAKARLQGLYVDILLNDLLKSDSLIDVKRSLPKLAIREMTYKNPALAVSISNYQFNGSNRHNKADRISMRMQNGSTLNIDGLYWDIFDWDLFQKYKLIAVDDLHIRQMKLNLAANQKRVRSQPPKDLPAIRIGRIDIDHFLFNDSNKSNIHFDGSAICLDAINTRKSFFQWGNAQALINNIAFRNQKMKVSIDQVIFNNEYQTVFNNTKFSSGNDSIYMKSHIPSIEIQADIHSTDLTALVIQNIEIREGSVRYQSLRKDTFSFTAQLNLQMSSLQTFTEKELLMNFKKLSIQMSDGKYKGKNTYAALPAVEIAMNAGSLSSDKENRMDFQTALHLSWIGEAFSFSKPGIMQVEINRFAGYFNDERFRIGKGEKMDWMTIAGKAGISKGEVYYKGKAVNAQAKSLQWDPKTRALTLGNFSISPVVGMEETFKQARWQSDYMTISGNLARLEDIHLKKTRDDSLISVRHIQLEDITLETHRDKRMPFHHGIEKPMPTKLMHALRYPVRIDSIDVQNGQVTVNEIAIKTQKQGSIPMKRINARLYGFNTRGNGTDSLQIIANMQLFGNEVRNFHYSESHADSLSAYRLYFNASPMKLTAFNPATVPLASLSVKKGQSDTLFAAWAGNKYASFGVMNFDYEDLKVQLLDARDPAKKKFLLSVMNMLANGLVLRKNNHKQSVVFFARDREKFVFNYWIKSVLGGIKSSVGLKSDRKYIKQYNQLREQYSLPAIGQ